MPEKLKVFVRRLIPERLLLPFLLLASYRNNSITQKFGYGRSVKSMASKDEKGDSIPWIPYWVTQILNQRLPAEATVFEFGGGQSTEYFLRRVRRVVTVEHNPEWVSQLKLVAGTNVEILQISDPAAYASSIRDQRNVFDLILVDGINRVACLENAVRSISDQGVIILDDSQRQEYVRAFGIAAEAGFRCLRLFGRKPGSVNMHEATLFYRDMNILGL